MLEFSIFMIQSWKNCGKTNKRNLSVSKWNFFPIGGRNKTIIQGKGFVKLLKGKK